MTKARVKGTDAAKYVKSAAQLQKVEAKVIIFFSFGHNNMLWFPFNEKCSNSFFKTGFN